MDLGAQGWHTSLRVISTVPIVAHNVEPNYCICDSACYSTCTYDKFSLGVSERSKDSIGILHEILNFLSPRAGRFPKVLDLWRTTGVGLTAAHRWRGQQPRATAAGALPTAVAIGARQEQKCISNPIEPDV